ncbi:MAG: family 16 glycosylhydrolase [Bacteroidales bacterium]|jgi:beta-glucanase (GH16 family)
MILPARKTVITLCTMIAVLATQCTSSHHDTGKTGASKNSDSSTVVVQAEDFINSKSPDAVKINEKNSTWVKTTRAGWLEYNVTIPQSGRYAVQLFASKSDSTDASCWLEDYADNKDGRTYNITGNMKLQAASAAEKFNMVRVTGSPLDSGLHVMRLHYDSGAVDIDKISFELIKPLRKTPVVLTQKTGGKSWKLAWSDEFDGKGLPDSTKWTFDIGNWGWGNNELENYTENRIENALQEGGNLIIEAQKSTSGWTSARLTTRGKESFLYGKIEFRAKVPSGRGTWSAGWILGDAYRDEISWPYCGEIDVLENVGFDVDKQTGNGRTTASVHCGAYYFKRGNQRSSVINVQNQKDAFHTYTVEWLPDRISMYLDGKKYFDYNDTSNSLTWPFNKPQNLVINLAIGGGWGGAKGVDPAITSEKLIVDYIRVYELK